MPTTDKRIDAYIAKSADFAQPILSHLRAVVHEACPDVEETMKWSFPHFMYGGGILCSMASFKEHCAFGFWKGSLIIDQEGEAAEKAMGQFGRIGSVKDLPSKRVLASYVKKAMALNDAGVKRPRSASDAAPKSPVAVPDDFAAALAKQKKARAAFEAFPPSHRREYVEWIVEAKRDDTRARRIAQAVEWIAEGKSRNWKYERT
jgi:uncharacterized protein YdeI (YjbR/CyaY-like superfamily)